MNLDKRQLQKLSEKVFAAVNSKQFEQALNLVKPLLDNKIPFSTLDKLGLLIGQKFPSLDSSLLTFYNQIIDYNAMGSYVLVAKSLTCFLPKQLDLVLEKARRYIINGDVWYVCDSIGERTIGQALSNQFDRTLPWIKKFLKGKNAWIRRSAGVAIHNFAKNNRNSPKQIKILLKTITPYIEETDKDALKGIGWGLKTIGHYYPQLAADFLTDQLKQNKKISSIIIRKSLTYLPQNYQNQIKHARSK